MLIERKLQKVFNSLPLVGFIGDGSDVSRYRILLELTCLIGYEQRIINKIITKHVSVVIYPMEYGTEIYAKSSITEEIIKYSSMDNIWDELDDIDTIIIPNKLSRQYYLLEFPGVWNEDYEFLFGAYLCQMILCESFPYGKESFENLLRKCIRTYSYSTSIKVVLYKSEIRYGATDISNEKTGIEKTKERLTKYTPNILVYEKNGEIQNILSHTSHLVKQYKSKKTEEIIQKEVMLKSSFELDYRNARERFLVNEGKNGYGILSNRCFLEVAKFGDIKGSNHIEHKILDNYIRLVQENKEYVLRFIDEVCMYYLMDVVNLSNEEKNRLFKLIVEGIDKNYKFAVSKKCPSTQIEYRLLRDSEKYLIRLETYLNNYFDRNIKMKIYQFISEKIKKCRENYI